MTSEEAFHHCHARGCKVLTDPTLLMCKKHWKIVPFRLQAAVWAHYRTDQCDDKRPSEEWFTAANAAIDFVFKKEQKKK